MPRPPDPWTWRKAAERLALAVLLLAAGAVLCIPLSQQTADHSDTLDFANFYTAGRIVAAGESGRLYDLRLQERIERRASPGGPFQPYYHPPFEALLFAPLSLLSYAHAFLLWAAINLLVLVLFFYQVKMADCRLRPGSYAIWLVMCLFFTLGVLALGQDSLLLAPVFLFAFLTLRKRQDFWAGIVLGLGLFRFEILLPFVFIFFLRRRWKLILGFSTACVVALAASAALVGQTGLFHYAKVLVQVGGSGSRPWTDQLNSVAMMPSLHGAVVTLLGKMVPPVLLFAITLAGTLGLLGWSAWKFRSLETPESPMFGMEFSLAVVAALLSSYHLFISELTPLMVVALFILEYEGSSPRNRVCENRYGLSLLLLIFGLVALGAVVHSQNFSIEVIPLLGLMVWLSREISARGGRMLSS